MRDRIVEEGANKGQTQLDIYEVRYGKLTICFAGPDKPRPSEFSAKEGSGNTVVVLRLRK